MFKKKRKFLKIKFMKRRISVKRVNIKELYKKLFKKLDVLYEKIKKRNLIENTFQKLNYPFLIGKILKSLTWLKILFL